jgi:HSP20 family molecular chaperone IbpA
MEIVMLTGWNPLEQSLAMLDEMRRQTNQPFPTRRHSTPIDASREDNVLATRIEAHEKPDEFVIVVDLPGVPQEKLKIDIEKGQLVLHAERVHPAHGPGSDAEARPQLFHRVFVLPRGIDADRIDAELKFGVLTLRLPKSAGSKPRRVDVRAS